MKGGAPGIPGMGGPLPAGEPDGGNGGGKGMPRPPGTAVIKISCQDGIILAAQFPRSYVCPGITNGNVE